VADPPIGVAGHPLGHGGGSATTRPAGLVVAEPPQWPKGVVPATLVKKKKKHERRRRGWFRPHGGGSATTRPAGMVVAEPPPWPRGGQPPPVGGSATLILFPFFFLYQGGRNHPHGLGSGQPPLWVDRPPGGFFRFLFFFLD
jgi:hypothetical protein